MKRGLPAIGVPREPSGPGSGSHHQPTMNQTISTAAADGADPMRSMLAALDRIEARIARLEAAASRVEALERTLTAATASATDTFDDVVDRLRTKGVDVDERLHVLLDVAERLTSSEALAVLTTILGKIELVQHLLDSGIVAEAPVDVIAKAGFALATARADAPREVGLWGAARAMSDDDVKRAVGFLIRVAQVFGRSLDEPEPARLAKGAAR